MASIFPGAAWRPMPGQEKRPKRRKGRGVGLHIAVFEGPSIWQINLGTGNDAHLYVRRDGSVEQNIDLDLQAYAGADGNSTMIWVETQGGTTAADVKSGRWTPQQVETLAQIAAWAHRTEGVPLQVMPDSRPVSRGIGTHRLGVQHSRGVGAVPGWLRTGGERWTKHIGKECPGDARIGQVPSIVDRARQIVNGSPPPQEDDDMPQLISHFVPAGEEHTYPIAPVESGAAGWGRAWLSVAFDRHGAPPSPSFVRIAVQGADGKYRPAFGNDITLPIAPGTRPVAQLRKGDQAVVVKSIDPTHGVGVLVEYARAT